jgi:hypothetical protein
MTGFLPSKNPNEHIGPEIGPEKNNPCNPLIKKIQHRSQEKQGNGIGNQVVQTSMQQRRGKYAYQTNGTPRNNAEESQGPSVKKFQIESCPHQKN